MIQYTTPSVGVRLTGVTVAPSQVDVAKLTLQPVTKDRRPIGESIDVVPQVTIDGSDTVVAATLTQQQSAAMPLGYYQAMVNLKLKDGRRIANLPTYGQVLRNLHEQVM